MINEQKKLYIAYNSAMCKKYLLRLKFIYKKK